MHIMWNDDDRESGDDADFDKESECAHPRKRICTPEKWKRNVNTVGRDAGQSYHTRAGVLKLAVLPQTDHNCRLKCFEHLGSTAGRQALFDQFRGYTHAEQTAYLKGLQEEHEPARRRPASQDESKYKRAYSAAWTINGKRVC